MILCGYQLSCSQTNTRRFLCLLTNILLLFSPCPAVSPFPSVPTDFGVPSLLFTFWCRTLFFGILHLYYTHELQLNAAAVKTHKNSAFCISAARFSALTECIGFLVFVGCRYCCCRVHYLHPAPLHGHRIVWHKSGPNCERITFEWSRTGICRPAELNKRYLHLSRCVRLCV